MDTQVEKCIEKVEEFEGIWCNEIDTQVEKCIEIDTQVEKCIEIDTEVEKCNEIDTQVEKCIEIVTQVANCIEDESEGRLIVPSGIRIFAMPCSWLHLNMMCSA